ncbi:eIF2A-related protein [Scytonema sp. PCC 10023]|uniref:WD40 domain-containing protein n=1 Tax=Scytonema sp. PCC 10023 TaxID=1680591 RepID=UPI0039C5C9E8
MTNIMNQQGQIEDIAAFNENSLQELNWAIESSGGEFSLILAHCNSASLRQRLTQELQASCRVEIRKIILEQAVTTLYTTIQAELGNEHPEAIIVSGLESVKAIDSMLTGANQVREEFRKNFPFPAVLWVTDEVLQKLIRLAPDLQSWTTAVEFAIPTEDLIQYIQQTADEVFAKVLEVGAGRFLDNTALNLGIGSPRRTELELARVELQNRGVTLHPEIESSLEFVLGRDAHGSMEQSRQHYERSLAILQQAAKQDKGTGEGTSPHLPISPSPHSPLPNLLERRACLLYCMGLWWRTYAVLHHTESDRSRATAKDYFQECITVFDQANREDLVANFINGLGAVLQRMQCWDELEAVARRAISLHQTYPHPFRLARAHGFQAEVALAKLAWKEAQEAAQQALEILDSAASTAENSVSSETIADLEWEQSSHRGWYLFALARAQIALGEKKQAIATLETAKVQTKAQYDPELYIEILSELRDCYFQQAEYLKAFNIKLELRSSEQTYGIRAFTGAGRLQPKQQVTNPALVLVEQQETVAQEIAATGREQDIKRLVERVARPDYKLTIIYGQSGVGKSSILQAGLIPVLKNKAIGTRDVVPVLQQVYPDWIRELGDRLAEALPQRRTSPPTPPLVGEGRQTPPFPSREGGLGGLGLSDTKSFTSNLLPINGEGAGDGVSAILNQLQTNADNELLTVLIFDQFEEFFFVYKDPKQRLTFYNFLRECLDVPHARVILALREDYLYYLLECNDRLTNLEVINNNILDKDILYYLGNFSRKDAKALIESFTHTTKLLLDAELIDALVEDLAGDFGEIRPIELQVVGTQLQTEKITTLAQYKKHGPKEELVGRFLEEVVKDCGTENEQIAKLVLYLLTDENNTRPLKTRADLELELEVKSETLDLVLLILVKSGLVFKVPAVPADRYQLVHDYLVPFVRQQQSQRLIAELEKEREQRKLTEAKLNQVLRKQLQDARRATFTLAGLAAIGGVAVTATLVGINLYLNNLSLYSGDKTKLESLVSSLNAGKKLTQLSLGAIPGTQLNVLTRLNQAIYTVREVKRLEGHQETVTSVSFSPKDKFLATVSKDKTVKIWSIDGKIVKTLPGHTDIVNAVSFSPNGKLLATASKDQTVKIWSIDEGREIQNLTGHKGSVKSVSFSPDGKMLATTSDDKTVKIWSFDGREIQTLQGHTGSVTSISFSPNGKILASADNDSVVKIWSLNRNLIKNIDNYGALSMSFSRDGKNIILTNKDKRIKSYDLNGTLLKNIGISEEIDLTKLSPDGKILAFVPRGSSTLSIKRNSNNAPDAKTLGSHSDIITDVSFSHDGKLLATASKDKTVKLWKIENPTFKLISNKENQYDNNSISFSPKGEIVATGSYQNNAVKLWTRDRRLIRNLEDATSVIEFSPDGKTLATSSDTQSVELSSLDGRDITLKGKPGRVGSIAFSPNGKTIASAIDKTVNLWSKSDGTFLKSLTEHNKTVKSINFSPDGKIIASIGDDNRVIIWTSEGKLIKILDGHTESVEEVTFSPDSQIIATRGDDNVVKLWRENGTFIKTLTGHTGQVKRIIFSPNSKIIGSVSEGDDGVKLWRRDGSLLNNIEYPGINDIRFSPDNSIIASINQDKTVKLWNLDGKLLKNFKKHNDTINDVSFSPDGETIASASDDGKIQLWRRDGSLIKTLRGHTSGVKKVRFIDPNREKIVSIGNDNMVLLWSREGELLKTLQKGREEVSVDYNHYNDINISLDSQIISFYSSFYSSAENEFLFTATMWNREGKKLKDIEKPYYVDFSNIKVSPDGKTVAFAITESPVKLWNVNNGRRLAILRGNINIRFSPDSKTIASFGEDNTVKLWKINSNGEWETRPYQTLKGHNDKVNSVSFNPDGKIIASASDDTTVKLWNSDGTPLKTLKHNGKVNNVSFNPTGTTIASAGEDNTVKLWRRDGTLLKSLPHSRPVYSVSFSPDGKMILSVTANNNESTIVLWNSNGTEIKTFQGSTFSFSSDVKKAEVRRQKAEGVPTNEFGGFNKVATRLFFSINKFRGFKPYGREQRTYFCIKAYLLSFCPLPSALCLSSVRY